MTQATTWGVPRVGPATPTAYAERADDSLDALLSCHRGASRPSYAVAGTLWIKEVSATVEEVYFFDGTNDLPWATINPTAGTIVYAGSPVPIAGGGHGQTTAPAALIALGAVAKAGDTMTGTLNIGSNPLTGVTSINGGPTPGQNAIINGDFRFNQRGAASYPENVYGLDRWQGNAAGSSLTHSQQTFALGQTDVPGEPKNYARCVVSSVAGAGNYAAYLHSIEGVRTVAGQTAILSFWAKADAAKNIAVELEQVFGTGGSPSAPVSGLGLSKLALTTAWQQFSVTVTLPSISGKTLGTAGNDRLGLIFWLDAGSDFNARTNTLGQQSGTFEFADVQLKLGSTVTPYDRIDDATELARCQRYYVNGFFRIQSAAVDASGTSGGRVTFPTFMRAAPTVIATSTFLTNSGAATTANPASDGFDVVASALAMGTPQVAGGTWTADAEF